MKQSCLSNGTADSPTTSLSPLVNHSTMDAVFNKELELDMCCFKINRSEASDVTVVTQIGSCSDSEWQDGK